MATGQSKANRGSAADVRIGDLMIFLGVHRYGTVNGAARALGTSASQVSKAIARLERQLNVVLMTRSAHGVTLTEEAMNALPRLEEAVSHLEQFARTDKQHVRSLAIGAASWLIEEFLPAIAVALPDVRLSGYELPPAIVRAHAVDNLFDVSLIVGNAELPPTWHRTPVGQVRLALFARPALAQLLGPAPVDAERLRTIPFVTPAYNVNGRLVQSDDDCPLRVSERRQGHKVQTIRVALSLASRVDQLVYGPVIAARRFVDAGLLVEVPVRSWETRSVALTLTCNPTQLRNHEHEAIAEAVRSTVNSSH